MLVVSFSHLAGVNFPDSDAAAGPASKRKRRQSSSGGGTEQWPEISLKHITKVTHAILARFVSKCVQYDSAISHIASNELISTHSHLLFCFPEGS